MSRGSRFARARIIATASAVLIPVAAFTAGSTPLHAAAGGETRMISAAGTASFPQGTAAGDTSAISNPETPGTVGADAGPSDRSHSGGSPVGATSQPTPVTNSTPGLLASFDGLNHFQNRFGAANQFSLEPPDQGLCVGNDGSGHTRVLEVVNDIMRVYTTAGTPVTGPVGLNAFLGYAPAIIRSPHIIFGPFVTDPACLYDSTTGRWFIDVLTLDTFPSPGSDGLQHFTGTNHIDIAVSDTSDPTGTWSFFHIPVQDDGTDGTPNHNCLPGHDTATPLPTNPTACFGDYPHIGADSNAIFITTNEYSFFGPEFHGAQVYAISKAGLIGGTAAVEQFNTQNMDTFGFARNGFTLWPSTTPGGGGDPAAGGTEWLLSSNAAAEAHDTGDGKSVAQPSTQLLVWALTNTSSIDSGSPALSLTNAEVNVGLYAPPPSAQQKSGNQPLRQCLNNNPCITFLEGAKDPFAEKPSNLDANDSRMQQVTWVNGKLWGALDTGLTTSNAKQAGIEWFDATVSSASGLTASLANSGYVGLGNDNLTYPAIGITSGGTGVMAFTVVGSDFYPSAGYAMVTSAGVGAIHVAAAGAGPDDGFTDYRFFANPPDFAARPRWGDYGAAVPVGGNVWLASEYIGQTCDLSTWERTNFRCDSTRTALANWDTRISEVAAP